MISRSSRVAGVIIAVSTLAFGLPASMAGSQQRDQQKEKSGQHPQRQDDPTIRLGTDLVVLDVAVVDPNNRPAMDLREEQFQVFEDKVQQKIAFFSREQVPISLVLTIDTSGSMRAKLDTVIKAATNLVKQSKGGDEVAVVEFKDQPELVEEFTSDVHDAIDALQGLVASRQTAMLDALYLAADYGSKEGKNRRKAVVVVTDGLDRDSYYKFDEVVNHLRETDVRIYLIGFTNDLSKDGAWVFGKSEKEKAEKLLTRLATETGGAAFFPRELSEMQNIAEQISIDLRTLYSIGYYPTNSKRDGLFRSVRVQINAGDRRLVPRTRAGYTAPKEGEQRPTQKTNP